jgi:hypothetical protein
MPAEVIWRLTGSAARVTKIHLVSDERPWKTLCGRDIGRRSLRTTDMPGDERCRQCAAIGTTEAVQK